jgi:hypothetical protein
VPEGTDTVLVAAVVVAIALEAEVVAASAGVPVDDGITGVIPVTGTDGPSCIWNHIEEPTRLIPKRTASITNALTNR